MANYSVNQVHQLYVAKRFADGTTVPAVGSATSQKGDLGGFQKIQDVLGDQIMFYYQGADSVLHSDLIQVANIGYAKAIKASDMATKMRKVKVSLNPNLNGGLPVSGRDYILGINFKNFFSSGDASQYYKDAGVHAVANQTAAQFYAAMKDALDKAFAREDGATATSNPYLVFSADANGLYIEEKPQEWQLGTKKARRIMFDLQFNTIKTSGDELIWGEEAEQTAATTVGNGQKIADLEWFCMGERGDQYRMKGWPNVIYTEYMVDPSQEYNLIELHYAFTDTGVNSYRTEKEITIAVPMGATGSEYDVINDIIGAINTATGLNIATL